MEDTDYDAGWDRWGDMIKYSPAPVHRRRLIVKLARRTGFKSVLDVGCGSGELLRQFKASFDVERLAGVDLSSSVVESNRRAMPFAAFHALDVSTAKLPEQFDLVVCSEVIEHIVDYRLALRNIRDMCSAFLIVTVPAGKVFPIDRMMGHHRHFTAATLTDSLENSGFRVALLWQWGFPWHTAYKYLINVAPETSMRRFSGGGYSWSDKLVGRVLTTMFYLNLNRFGSQLIALARTA